jgi:hypothetical protein
MSDYKPLAPIVSNKVGIDAYTGQPTIDYMAYEKVGLDELLALYPTHTLFVRDLTAAPDYYSLIPMDVLEAKEYPLVLSVIGPVEREMKHIVLEAAGLTEIEALCARLKQNEQEAKQGNFLMTTDITNVNYFELIRDWGKARNIIGGGSTPIDQFIKGLTEAAEAWANILGKQPEKLKDDIGDILVCLTQSYGIIGINIEEATGDAELEISSARENYKEFGEWALKRFALRVLRRLSTISWEIEAAQFEEDSFDTDSLLEDTGTLIAELTAIAEGQGWTLQECLKEAYDDIKDRKGVMYNGGFVKEASLTVERAQEMLDSGTVGGVGAEYLTGYIAANS